MRWFTYFGMSMVFILLIWFFAPKAQLYYALEERLAQEAITVLHEKVLSDPFGIKLQHAELNVKGMDFLDIPTASIALYGFYNRLDLYEVHVKHTFFKWMPETISHLKFMHSFISPRQIVFELRADFGKIEGAYDFKTQMLYAMLLPDEKKKGRYKELLKYFKEEKGTYRYEKQIVLAP